MVRAETWPLTGNAELLKVPLSQALFPGTQSMALPILTVLQSLILTILFDEFKRSEHGNGDGEVSGPGLREELRKRRVLKTGPAFYQCMSRLVDAGFVVDRYEPVKINDQMLREKRYRITGEGI